MTQRDYYSSKSRLPEGMHVETPEALRSRQRRCNSNHTNNIIEDIAGTNVNPNGVFGYLPVYLNGDEKRGGLSH